MSEDFGKLLPELGDDVSEAADPLDALHDDGPITDNGGAMTLDGLRLFFIARDDERDARDAKQAQEDRDWKDAHEARARDRDMAIQTILERDRQQNRKEHDEFRDDIHSIKNHGIPRLNRWMIAGALVCLVALVCISSGDLWFRVYAFQHAPVLRAPR